MNIELKLELGHRASLRNEPAPDGFTHDWMIFVRGTKGNNISHVVDRVVFHLHESYKDPNKNTNEPRPRRISKSGHTCFLMPIDVYFRNHWKLRRIRLEYELSFPLGESPVYNICHERLVFMNPPEDFHRCLVKAGGVMVSDEVIKAQHIFHLHDPHRHPRHHIFPAKQDVCKGVCRETLGSVCRDAVESVCRESVESVCRDTVESVCGETGGSICNSELSMHGKCDPIRLNKSCAIPYDLHCHPQQPHDVKETFKGTAHNDSVTVCGPKNIKVKLELGHRASIRDHPTREGSTHDWMVFVRGIEGCNISHFVEKVVFYLHESFPNRKRVVKKPPFQVTESGFGGFVMPIEVYFRNDEEPRKVRFEYDLFVRLKGPPILNIHREKLLFRNPTDDFRRRLLKARGDWCREHHDKGVETGSHVNRSLLQQFEEIEHAEKMAAIKEHKKLHRKEFCKDSEPICQAENVVLSLDFRHHCSVLEKPLPDGSTYTWSMEVRGFKGANISYFVDKVVFHLHESYPFPTRVVKDAPYEVSEHGFSGFIMPIDVYLQSEEEPKKIQFQYDMYLGVDTFPVNVVCREKVVFQNPMPDLRERLLKAGGVLVHRKCPVHHQEPKKGHPPPPPPPHMDEIHQHPYGDLAMPNHDPVIDELEAIRIQEALVRKKCPVHHEDENCDTTLCATLLQHIQELEEAERANGNSNGRPIETEPLMYLGSQRVDKKRNASIACFLMAKNAEQEDIQNKKLRIAAHNPCFDLSPCGAHAAFEDADAPNECCVALPSIAPPADVVDLACMICAEMKREVLFYPCGHIALCSLCSTTVKDCIICEEPVELGIKIGDCVVCSDKKASVIFEPCAHVCACDGCAALMKNCIQCQEHIEETIPVTEFPDGFEPEPRAPSPCYSDASTIEEIVLDTHFPENSNTDIEKLQQELQDIKEQTMCPVCLDRLKNVIFMCGHGTCQICSKPITKCPVCRKPVKKHIVLY